MTRLNTRGVRAGVLALTKGSVALTFFSAGMLFASAAVVRGHDAAAMLRAGAQVAEVLPTDVTRLALTVAALAICLNGVCFGWFVYLLSRGLARPCIMHSQAGEAVLREALRKARSEGS